MSVIDPSLGLRERKKIKTRLAIRREAFRLIEKQGYGNTTVEQIADAADVSTSTFFRYFSSKESVLLNDELVEPIIDAFIDAPAELPPIAAYRHAVEVTFGALTDAQRESAIAGQRLMYSVPEAQGLLYGMYMRCLTLITDALKFRLTEPADEFERRMIAGAIVGVLIAASDGTPLPDDQLSRGLTFLEGALPLR
ncbi:TetR family transcriptional regulator [Mycolicibacterium mengxianglii]|uniref:TetR family transcriptional regulator n=1 Tax=Mycolicibacterium mengxianglii TaxID=2736649 RepID=UPI0018D0FD0E|nr:TetR family transcriptional regulator [Mycolicibacterium mengxianglii]